MKAYRHGSDGASEVTRIEETRRRHGVLTAVHAFDQGAPKAEAAGTTDPGTTLCFVMGKTYLTSLSPCSYVRNIR